MTTFSALAINKRPSGELATALAVLEQSLPTVVLPTLSAAIEQYAAGAELPDLLVLFQSRSGEFSESELLRLRAWMPLARCVAVLGSWSEGELRSGQPLPGVRRVPWHCWPLRLERELAAWRAGSGGTWSLPATAAEEELFLQADATAAARGEPPQIGPIAIHSAYAQWAACLVDALGHRGYQATSLRPGQLSRTQEFAALVDDLTLPANGSELSARYRAWLPRPIIALADFPRRNDERIAREAGAAALLGKPLDIDELLLRLDQLLNPVTTGAH